MRSTATEGSKKIKTPEGGLSEAEPGEPAEAGPLSDWRRTIRAELAEVEWFSGREQRPVPTGGSPTLRAAQAGRDRDWRRIIRSELAETE